MKKTDNSIRITLWANRSIALIMGILMFTMPLIMEWLCQVRSMTGSEKTAVLIAFYACSIPVFFALFQMDRLLCNLRGGEVFSGSNVRKIRLLQWCSGITALICIPASFAYHPLLIMVVIMSFLCLVIGVLCQVMDAAVTIREENDLTI